MIATMTVEKLPSQSSIEHSPAALNPVTNSQDALELAYELSIKRQHALMEQMHIDPVLRERIESRLS